MTNESPRRALRHGILFIALLLTASGSLVEREPLDGGRPIRLGNRHADQSDLRDPDPCWRRERGGWHYSIGHCAEMLPLQRMTGVWTRAYEESSFFPGTTAKPDPDDLLRYTINLEIDPKQLDRFIGPKIVAPPGDAVALTFVGRRTKYPYNIDCYGSHYHTVVVHRVESARDLGIMAPPNFALFSERPRPILKRSGKGGVIGRLEVQAAAHCGGFG